MNSNLNRGAWKSMENEWARALSSEPTKTVTMDIDPVYKGENKRPDRFVVKYTIDGEPHKSIFRDRLGG